jgi:hypothetical protein
MPDMKRDLMLLSTLFLLLEFAASIVYACKISEQISPNLLVSTADAIVRVRATSYRAGQSSTYGRVKMDVLQILKGDLANRSFFFVDGNVNDYQGKNDGTVPYSSVRPGGQQGTCYAYDYRLGGQFLLFLREGTPYWAPLAATNEEVDGPNDPWVLWVEELLHIKEVSPNR